MPHVVNAEGALLHQIIDGDYHNPGLDRQARGRLEAARTKTAWGRVHRRRFALVEGTTLLASATRYRASGQLDERPVSICAIGAVLTAPQHRGAGHACALVEHLLDDAAKDGADLALLFSPMGASWCEHHGFERLPITEVAIDVAQSPRHGAPMTPIRAGESRDLGAITAMGRTRAAALRFHLDRDIDVIQHAIASKRLLAGCEPAGARQLHFFIAEEGITAAAYLVISVIGNRWAIEECGDRDAGGARIGAMLQALIAREPAERRPSIRGWLWPGFLPPQVTIMSTKPSATITIRALRSAIVPRLSEDDVLYWHSDSFQ